MTPEARERCIAARDALMRARMHVEAGIVEPTPEMMHELISLLCALAMATPETIDSVAQRVEAFMLRVAPRKETS